MTKDSDIEKNKLVMERIWAEIPKEYNLPPSFSGEYIRYTHTDPKYLYLTGFVDTKRFKIEEWEAAFADCKQADATFLISKEKFISLGKYKYSGPIKNPLDPMKIREGWYDINAWHEFCVKSILPSTVATVEELVQSEKIYKEKGLITNGKILVDKTFKLRLLNVLNNYPSPARHRELAVADIHQKRLAAEAERSQSPIVKTTFQKGQRLGEKEKKNLSEALLKNSQINPKTTEKPSTLSVKDLKKKSKTKKQPL